MTAPGEHCGCGHRFEAHRAYADGNTSCYKRYCKCQAFEPGVPVPKRITMALDSRQLYGPQVDAACGAAEPDVDLWETGQRRPTFAQVEALAELTGYPTPFFYRPVPPFEGVMFLCARGKGGCQVVVGDNRKDPEGHQMALPLD